LQALYRFSFYDGNSDCQRLENVLRVDFRNRRVELMPRFFNKNSADLPLIF
jgi:hypothetical protein